MRKSGPARRPPSGIAGGQRLPHLRGHPLAAHPGRVPGNQIEPAARQDVGEVRFEREERGTALAGETARGHPELAATGAHPPEQSALVRPKPLPPSEQIAILARGDQLGGAPLERRDRCREQAPCERPLGIGELTQRLLLGRSGEAEERAPGAREPLDLPGRNEGCGGAAERTAGSSTATRRRSGRASGGSPWCSQRSAAIGARPKRWTRIAARPARTISRTIDAGV